jgi:hypothetical protein
MLDAAIRVGLIALILLGGVIMTPMALQVLGGGPKQQAQSANQAYDEPREAQAPTPNVAPFGSVEQAKAAERRQEARDEADVHAQQGMMIAATVQAALSLLALVGLYFTVRYARRAWRESKRGADAALKAAQTAEQANADAREFFAAERRPWIEIIPMETTIVAGEQHAKIAYVLSNIGLSPALNVGVTTPEACANHRLPSFMDLRRRMQESAPHHAVGPFIFPQKVRHGEILVPLSGLKQAPLESPIYLEGFVEYQSRNGAPFFFTPFVWVLKFNRDGGRDGPPAAERIDVSYFSPPPT